MRGGLIGWIDPRRTERCSICSSSILSAIRGWGSSPWTRFRPMRTTRVGIGWTRDSRKLYLLFVKEPDAEGPSLMAAEHGIGMAGGWSVPDVARFFVALGVWGAINSDAGDAGQLIYRTREGRY